MKISRLYGKFFISVLLVLLFSEILVFFIIDAGLPETPRMRRFERQLLLAKNVVETQLENYSSFPKSETELILPQLKTLAKSFNGQIWITGPNNDLITSTKPSLPSTVKEMQNPPEITNSNCYLYESTEGKNRSFYSVLSSYKPKDYPFTYHIYYKKLKHDEETWFLWAQAIITLLTAIFLIPVSLHIIRPLKRLTNSASKLGKGDFSQRVKVSGKDEMAELSKAFNLMASSVEKLVASARDLTANVSHELRSPLTRMRISLEMLNERLNAGQDDLNQSFINSMQEEIEHMNTMIGEILEFSKLDMKTTHTMEDNLELDKTLHVILSRYSQTANHKNILIDSQIEKATLNQCNKGMIVTLLENIVGNAFKYTKDGKNINISLKNKKGNIIFKVENSYNKIKDKDLEQIFMPFHRLETDAAGSGLGLATCKKITEYHGGEIYARNTKEGFQIITIIKKIDN